MSKSDLNTEQRKLIRTIALEVAYEILEEHLDEYKHTPKKLDQTEIESDKT